MFSGQKKDMMMMNNKSTTFAQTCNRLSQFLKERRSLGDFAAFPILDINGGKDEMALAGNRTMNLFPKKMEEEENPKSLELFPLTNSAATSSNNTDHDESNKNVADWSEATIPKEDSKANGGKMTIFYNGQVIVFEDLPEDKAEEIMSLATQLGAAETPAPAPVTARAPAQIPASVSDIPIARRVSLHRFMEKRKDRIAASSPYPLQRNASQSHVEKYDLMRQLRQKQHQQPEQLELKLF